MRILGIVLLLEIGLASNGVAQEARSPYAGEEGREIKAMSAAEVEGLLAGEGLGFAKTAELNGYPGPSHVLELAEQLELSGEQMAITQVIAEEMREQAVRLGELIVVEEAKLEAHFADRSIDEATLRSLVSKIASLRGELRRVHLEAHLAMVGVLTHEQTLHYDQLRGYADRTHGDEPAHRHDR